MEVPETTCNICFQDYVITKTCNKFELYKLLELVQAAIPTTKEFMTICFLCEKEILRLQKFLALLDQSNEYLADTTFPNIECEIKVEEESATEVSYDAVQCSVFLKTELFEPAECEINFENPQLITAKDGHEIYREDERWHRRMRRMVTEQAQEQNFDEPNPNPEKLEKMRASAERMQEARKRIAEKKRKVAERLQARKQQLKEELTEEEKAARIKEQREKWREAKLFRKKMLEDVYPFKAARMRRIAAERERERRRRLKELNSFLAVERKGATKKVRDKEENPRGERGKDLGESSQEPKETAVA